MQRVPDVFEMPDPMPGKPRSWLTALAMTAIVIGATLALVVVNEAPREEPQVTVAR
jgi:multisubunit Na+/H+ antiporter MnhC subunit